MQERREPPIVQARKMLWSDKLAAVDVRTRLRMGIIMGPQENLAEAFIATQRNTRVL
jgi:hypothetical protein